MLKNQHPYFSFFFSSILVQAEVSALFDDGDEEDRQPAKTAKKLAARPSKSVPAKAADTSATDLEEDDDFARLDQLMSQ